MLENMYKAFRNVLVVMILVMIVGVVAKVSAQDEPEQVWTGFTVSCQSGDPARIFFLAESNGVEHYTLSMVGVAPFFTSIPLEFDTQVGKYLIGWVDNSAGNIEQVVFTNQDGLSGAMPLAADYFTWCDHDDVTEIPTPAPDEPMYEAPLCLAKAWRSDDNSYYCYTPVPSGVVPLPPAINN